MAAKRPGLTQALGGQQNMAISDLLELGDLLMSWRLYVGIAITAAICFGIMQVAPNDTVGWTISIPIGLIGLFLSFRWQIRND